MELLQVGKRFCKDIIWNIFYGLFSLSDFSMYPVPLYLCSLFFGLGQKPSPTVVHFAQMCWKHFSPNCVIT